MNILTQKQLSNKVDKCGMAEKMTKKLLGELSRELLAYVYESKDVAIINRLIKVLSPVNKQYAGVFFSHFVGWTYDKETMTFGKQQKKAPFTKKSYLVEEFLSNKDGNIWTWSKENIDPPVKAKNYGIKISKLIDKALSDEKEGIDLREVLFAIVASDAVTLGDLMQSLDDVLKVEVAA